MLGSPKILKKSQNYENVKVKEKEILPFCRVVFVYGPMVERIDGFNGTVGANVVNW